MADETLRFGIEIDEAGRATIDLQKFRRELEAIRKETRSASRSTDQLDDSFEDLDEGIISLRRDLLRTEKAIDKVEDTSAKLRRENQRGLSAWQRLAITVTGINQAFSLIDRTVGRVARGVFRFASTVVTTAANFEALRTRLIGLTGSAEAASAAFNRMQRLAAITPFNLSEVVEAGVQLEAFGLSADTALKSVTDLAAFMGRDLKLAAFAVGRGFAGGLGASEILREGGVIERVKAFTGLSQKQLTDVQTFQKALLDTIENDPAIAGSADRLSKTFNGIVSNIEDSIEVALNTIAEAGFFDAVKDQAQEFLDLLEEMDENGQLTDLAAQISGALTDALEKAQDAAKGIDPVAIIQGSVAAAELAVSMAKITADGIKFFASLPPQVLAALAGAAAGSLFGPGGAAFGAAAGATGTTGFFQDAAAESSRRIRDEQLRRQLLDPDSDINRSNRLGLQSVEPTVDELLALANAATTATERTRLLTEAEEQAGMTFATADEVIGQSVESVTVFGKAAEATGKDAGKLAGEIAKAGVVFLKLEQEVRNTAESMQDFVGPPSAVRAEIDALVVSLADEAKLLGMTTEQVEALVTAKIGLAAQSARETQEREFAKGTLRELQNEYRVLTGEITAADAANQKRLRTAVGGAPEQLKDEVDALTRDIIALEAAQADLGAGFVDLFDIATDSLTTFLDSLARGTLDMDEFGESIKASLVKGFVEGFAEAFKSKLGFEGDFKVNLVGFLRDVGGIISGGSGGSFGGILGGLSSAFGGNVQLGGLGSLGALLPLLLEIGGSQDIINGQPVTSRQTLQRSLGAILSINNFLNTLGSGVTLGGALGAGLRFAGPGSVAAFNTATALAGFGGISSAAIGGIGALNATGFVPAVGAGAGLTGAAAVAPQAAGAGFSLAGGALPILGALAGIYGGHVGATRLKEGTRNDLDTTSAVLQIIGGALGPGLGTLFTVGSIIIDSLNKPSAEFKQRTFIDEIQKAFSDRGLRAIPGARRFGAKQIAADNSGGDGGFRNLDAQEIAFGAILAGQRGGRSSRPFAGNIARAARGSDLDIERAAQALFHLRGAVRAINRVFDGGTQQADVYRLAVQGVIEIFTNLPGEISKRVGDKLLEQGQGTRLTQRELNQFRKQDVRPSAQALAGIVAQAPNEQALLAGLAGPVATRFKEELDKQFDRIVGPILAEPFFDIRTGFKQARKRKSEGGTDVTPEEIDDIIRNATESLLVGAASIGDAAELLEKANQAGVIFAAELQLASGDFAGAMATIESGLAPFIQVLQGLRDLQIGIEERVGLISAEGPFGPAEAALAAARRREERGTDRLGNLIGAEPGTFGDVIAQVSEFFTVFQALFDGVDAVGRPTPEVGVGSGGQFRLPEDILPGVEGFFGLNPAQQLSLLQEFADLRLSTLEAEINLARQQEQFFRAAADAFGALSDQIDDLRRGPRAGRARFESDFAEIREAFAGALAGDTDDIATFLRLAPTLLAQGQSLFGASSPLFTDLLDFLEPALAALGISSLDAAEKAADQKDAAIKNAEEFRDLILPVLGELEIRAAGAVVNELTKIQRLLDFDSPIHGVLAAIAKDQGVEIPEPPELHSGGVTRRAGLANLSANELVLPLDSPAARQQITGGTGVGGSSSLSLSITRDPLTADGIIDAVIEALQTGQRAELTDELRRQGFQ